jgi:quercetin dioxygenase-like cupin family protein
VPRLLLDPVERGQPVRASADVPPGLSPRGGGPASPDAPPGPVSDRAGLEIRHIDELDGDLAAKQLIQGPDTGFTNQWHTHNCAHGMSVLDGILKTHAGSFGPGSFVWFPEGMEMEHGATQDNDVTFLFIANKPLDIHYTQLGQPGPAG